MRDLWWLVLASVLAAPSQAIPAPFDISRPLPYFIADGKGKTGFRASDSELARWALEDWQRSSGHAIQFEPASEPSSLVRLYWAEPSEGEYGEMKPIVVAARVEVPSLLITLIGSPGFRSVARSTGTDT